MSVPAFGMANGLRPASPLNDEEAQTRARSQAVYNRLNPGGADISHVQQPVAPAAPSSSGGSSYQNWWGETDEGRKASQMVESGDIDPWFADNGIDLSGRGVLNQQDARQSILDAVKTYNNWSAQPHGNDPVKDSYWNGIANNGWDSLTNASADQVMNLAKKGVNNNQSVYRAI